jgi:hypothetical protein
VTDFSATQGIAETSPPFVGASAVIRRGLRPTIGVQCGPSMTAYKPFAGNLKKLRRVGPSWAPMWVDLESDLHAEPSQQLIRARALE